MDRTCVALALAIVCAPLAHADDVTWTSATGVSVSGNDLTKTGTDGAWNSGAISTVQLDWGPAYVEATASETTTYRTFGLSKGSADNSNTDIDFGLYMAASGTLYVYESGGNKYTGTYATNDRLRVEAEPGVVRYLRDVGLDVEGLFVHAT